MKWLRKMYDWVLTWAETPYGTLALFVLAVAESSFFPIPPDVLLVALCIGAFTRSFWFAFVCSVGSVIGGMIGYLIGWQAFDLIGLPIIKFLGVIDLYKEAEIAFNGGAGWGIVAGAGFTPFPYKVITITAGACKMPFIPFVIVSAISRAARFFLVAAIIRFTYQKYGDKIQFWIDKYFNWLCIAFTVLLVLGFVALKFIKH